MRPRMGETRKNRDLAIDLGCSGAGGVERGRQKASTLSVGGWQARHGCDRSGLLLGVHGAEPPIAAIGCKSLLAGHLRPKLRICPDKSRFRKLSGTPKITGQFHGLNYFRSVTPALFFSSRSYLTQPATLCVKLKCTRHFEYSSYPPIMPCNRTYFVR